jgi:ribonuclease PH
MSAKRPHGRAVDALRPARIEPGAMKYAEGSALVEMGDTKVLVSASVESRVPPFLIDSGKGWVTAEYAMLPRATHTRSRREVSKGKPSGRSSEIQRLIGRSLRAVVDLSAMAERTVAIDCDVIQADGGTRTASITGAYVALAQAFGNMLLAGDIKRWPIVAPLAAVSVGIVDGVALLDLEASEDQRAEVDMNVVATGGGDLVEVQGTGEKSTFSREQLDHLLDLAFGGLRKLNEVQNQALAPTLADVESVLAKGERRKAEPRDEKTLWGRPES